MLRDVKALADALGARRDPDVQLDALDRIAAELPTADRPGIEVLADIFRSEQAQGNETLAAALRAMEEHDLRGRLLALCAPPGQDAPGRGGGHDMKAKKVKGLDPRARRRPRRADRPQAAATSCTTSSQGARARRGATLHDLRIAAKRLRYLLELFGGLFGPYAGTAAKRMKELQDVLGELHDCDVTLPRVRAAQEALREQSVRELVAASKDAQDVEVGALARDPHATTWRGLENLAILLLARRAVRFSQFLDLWKHLEREGLRARLEFALGERPDASPSPSHDGARA